MVTATEAYGDAPLAGIRVVDVTSARSGPACTRQLADLGAEVVHVGRPGEPDLTGSDAANLQRGKRSIVVDLRNDAGRRVVRRLAATADVFVENWRPEVKARLGLGPDVLVATNPRLVYASISGFGQDGPYANRPCVDQIAQGMSGLMSVTGPAGTGPWRVGVAISDLVAATFMTQAILAALVARQRTGHGQWVRTSLLETMVNLLDFQGVRWLVDNELPGQEGNNHPTLPAMGTFRTADGYINVAVLSRFEEFCRAIGRPDLLHDERYRSPSLRKAHRAALAEAIQSALLTRPTREWLERLGPRVPCGPVLRVDEVFANPQVRHLGMTAEVDYPAGRTSLLRYPVTFSVSQTVVPRRVPLRGGDAGAILADAGFGDDEIGRLYEQGAVVPPTDERGTGP